ncbi:Uncharacterised protein [Chromobacterium violaceum]|uniref:Uncharacterized protein n=1 Tax=Chromobacterium violaceum TaxID=536 RepID=A0A447TJ61_CHRVL|nr:Uncharacterised protein [Chromobacterium violaceum]
MVSVVRTVADTLADAADPARWLEHMSAAFPDEDGALLARAFHAARELYAGKTVPPPAKTCSPTRWPQRPSSPT